MFPELNVRYLIDADDEVIVVSDVIPMIGKGKTHLEAFNKFLKFAKIWFDREDQQKKWGLVYKEPEYEQPEI